MKWAVGRTGVGKIGRVIFFGILLFLADRISERSHMPVVFYGLVVISGLISAINLVAFMLPREHPIDRSLEPEFGEEFVTVFDPHVWAPEDAQPEEPPRNSSVRVGTREKQAA